jgi:SAM-dependent methyltransferase
MNTQGNCQNLLYDRPEIYEYLYPETDDATPVMCRRIFERYRGARPQSILDVACGTGRDLRSLRRECTDCVGVDLLPGMIAHAQSRAPEIPFVVGDMRDFRLGRTFEVVVCFGSAILYAHSNEDLDRTFATFAEHTHEGSLLILDLRNAAALLGDGFKARMEGVVETEKFCARWEAEHSLNRREQRLVRRRRWLFSDGDVAEDYCEYRLIFPLELERLIDAAGFRLLGLFDNKELKQTDLSGPTLYAVARR